MQDYIRMMCKRGKRPFVHGYPIGKGKLGFYVCFYEFQAGRIFILNKNGVVCGEPMFNLG